VEHLVGGGRPTYLVDHADAPLADRSLDMERWVVDVLPWAVDEVRRHAGGRPVHLVGWGVGAVLALLVAADRSGPPIGSVTSLGAPVDLTLVPAVTPFRPFLDVAGERTGLVSHAYRLLAGGAPPLVRRAFQLSAVNRLVSRPMAIAAGLDDADFLAQVEAVGRFTQQTVPYPGRAYGRTYHLLLEGHDLAGGTIALGDREISLADLTAPLLAIAGAADGIAPVESVRPLVDLTSGVDDLRFEVVPGGHLGLLTGRAARRTTWPLIDEWLSDHSSTVARTRPARRPAGRSAAPRAASREAIGSNPRRRYGSASSRTLAPR
jgi:polyhydroxyalkanoate synthase